MSLLGKLTRPFRTLWVPVVLLVALGCVTAVRIYFASGSRRKADDPVTKQQAQLKAAPKAQAGKSQVPEPVTANFGETFSNFVLPPELPKKDEVKRPLPRGTSPHPAGYIGLAVQPNPGRPPRAHRGAGAHRGRDTPPPAGLGALWGPETPEPDLARSNQAGT